eukprot:TRINITY_DN82767_c0_g1_i1.p1 TRINITY_DN82767_c0_g1~~TRINITY_DN82767_c0_g1_i1.p1  ORF type:complete len:235 (+),score=56.30 TRINITY_DN82767_c0_g1_i1:98-802(+)
MIKRKSKSKAVCRADFVSGRYKKRSHETNDLHLKLLEEVSPRICLIGTSMFERYEHAEEASIVWKEMAMEKYGIANFGCGGDMLRNIRYRLDHEECHLLDSLVEKCHPHPHTFIVMGGANDVERAPVDDMVQCMRLIIESIRQHFPLARVVVLGMFPRLSDSVPEDILSKKVKEYNDRIQDFDGIEYRWCGDQILGPDGKIEKEKYLVDHVHLSEEGYKILTKMLISIIEEKPM